MHLMTTKLLTTPQTAAMLDLAPNTLEIWRWKGKGPIFRRMGDKAVRYAEDDLLAFINAGARTLTTKGADHA
jgi:hypothetical protein